MGKTRKVMAGITTTALTIGLAGCGSDQADIPAPPNEEGCSDWEWDEDDGVWECDDRKSSYFGHYYLAGMFFANKSSLKSSAAYKSYQNSPSFKGGNKTSTGFGTGTNSFGG